MLLNQRIILLNDGDLTDLSKDLNDAASASDATQEILAADDGYLYLGSDLPFNHRYFDMTVDGENSVAPSAIETIEVWDGNEWVEAVDVIDQTVLDNATLGQSGIVSWTLDRNQSWVQEDSTEDMTDSGLEDLKIYGMYWVRIGFTVNLGSGLSINYIGHKFAKDSDLGAYYPDLIRASVMAAHTEDKTDWNLQHIIAAEEICRELRKARVIWNPNQLFNWEQFNLAGIHKCAEILFSSFGEAFEEQRKIALGKYKSEVNQGVFVVDRNENGRVEEVERRPYIGMVRR